MFEVDCRRPKGRHSCSNSGTQEAELNSVKKNITCLYLKCGMIPRGHNGANSWANNNIIKNIPVYLLSVLILSLGPKVSRRKFFYLNLESLHLNLTDLKLIMHCN